ncbi:lysine--tRNA ligase [Candidatus Bipolaricaulota bacterium]
MSDPLIQARLDKLRHLQDRGITPYPNRVPDVQPISPLLEAHAALSPEEHSGVRVSVAGRLMAFRRMGKASFFDLRDGGAGIQIHATVDGLGEAAYELLESTDVGDFLAVSGEVFRTKRGELSISAAEWTFLAKAIRPLPEKWHGLKDVELRYRHRSLDLISNDEVRETFIKRSQLLSCIRRTLDSQGFIEVETPSLLGIASGGHARPFVTHHNTLDLDMYLRIALELYLKRILIGGIDRVYEMGKCYRNEGVSTEHNPEFTMLEIYQAYADYEDMMTLAGTLIREGLQATVGEQRVVFRGHTIDLDAPWRRVSMVDAVAEVLGVDPAGLRSNEAIEMAKARGIDPAPGTSGAAIGALFERFVEETLIQPTFVTDYPIELSPLAKRTTDDPAFVERFELFAGGLELANAFTELNDPIDQRERFDLQERLRAQGDDEAQRIDEDFLFAIEHGMPPAGGMGVGIDRVVMLCTGAPSIRDVIFFPTQRRKS